MNADVGWRLRGVSPFFLGRNKNGQGLVAKRSPNEGRAVAMIERGRIKGDVRNAENPDCNWL